MTMARMKHTIITSLLFVLMFHDLQRRTDLQATWDGPRTAQIAWSDATPDACLWYQRPQHPGAYLLGCGTAGQVRLGPGGDVLSLPATGGTLMLRDEAAQQIVAQLRLPPHGLVLWVVVR